MTRKLLIVFASGLVFAIVLLSSAWVLGGPTLMRNGGWSLDLDGVDAGPHVTRELTFDPSVPLEIAMPAEIEFTRSDVTSMKVTGRKRVMDLLVWDNGELTLRENSLNLGGGVTVKIAAPTMPELVISGPVNVELEDMRQQEFNLTMAGAGNVEASGKVEKLVVGASGAGNVDLSDLETVDADVDLAGFGNADINASGKVEASIAGAGNVTLHRKPRELDSSIAGLGSVNHNY